MSTDRNPLSDKEVWQRVAAPAAAPGSGLPGTVSDMDLAAWLEGRLSEAEAASIDAAVAADPALRRGVLDLADVLGKPLPAPSPRLVVRAQALVGFEAEQVSPRGGLLSRLFAPSAISRGAMFGVPRAAMATLALGIAVAGFLLGGGLGESYAQQKYVVASNQTTMTSNELTAFFGSDGI